MSSKCAKPIFINIELEPRIQRGLNDTHVVQLNEALKNGSNSNCNFQKVGHPIPIKSTQPKRRYTRKCHYGKKPCGISLVKYLWSPELAKFRRSSCFSSILKDSSSRSIALSCLTEISELLRNTRRNHSTCTVFQIKETKSVF